MKKKIALAAILGLFLGLGSRSFSQQSPQYASLLEAIAESDPTFAMGFLDQVEHGDLSSLANGIATGLFQQDPLAALEFAKIHLPGTPRLPLDRWAVIAPRNSLNWAFDHKAYQFQTMVAPELELDAKITGLPTSHFKNGILGDFARLTAKTDPLKAIALAESQPGKGKTDVLGAIGGQATIDDSPFAKEILSKIFAIDNTERAPGDSFELPHYAYTLLQKDPL